MQNKNKLFHQEIPMLHMEVACACLKENMPASPRVGAIVKTCGSFPQCMSLLEDWITHTVPTKGKEKDPLP